MAMRVVLYHRPQGHQVGGAACLSLGSPRAARVVGHQRPRLGTTPGRAFVAGPHQGSLRKRSQPGQSEASHADPPNTARQTLLPSSMGV